MYVQSSTSQQFYQATIGTLVLVAAWQIASYLFSALSVPAGPGHRRAHRPHPDQLARAVAGARNRGANFCGADWRVPARLRGRVDHRPLAQDRELHHAAAGVPAGHPRAVLGDHRDHLVSRHRVPHLLHHGDHHVAGLHLSDPGCLSVDVEGSVRDDDVVPAQRVDPVPCFDRADHRAGHPDGLEGQSRQRGARRGGGGAGWRHRRRRLRASCASSSCSTWRARWRGPFSSCCLCWSCSRRS